MNSCVSFTGKFLHFRLCFTIGQQAEKCPVFASQVRLRFLQQGENNRRSPLTGGIGHHFAVGLHIIDTNSALLTISEPRQQSPKDPVILVLYTNQSS